MLHFFILTRKYQKGKVKEKKGNTCKPMAVSFQCMTKSTTNKKKEKRKKKSLFKSHPKKKKTLGKNLP